MQLMSCPYAVKSRFTSPVPPPQATSSERSPVKRVRSESEENSCPAKKPRRQAGIRAKQEISELPPPDEKDMCGSRP